MEPSTEKNTKMVILAIQDWLEHQMITSSLKQVLLILLNCTMVFFKMKIHEVGKEKCRVQEQRMDKFFLSHELQASDPSEKKKLSAWTTPCHTP